MAIKIFGKFAWFIKILDILSRILKKPIQADLSAKNTIVLLGHFEDMQPGQKFNLA
jgi:hypothetical protein